MKAMVAMLLCLFSLGCSSAQVEKFCVGLIEAIPTKGASSSSSFKPNAYGPGVNANAYGQPVTVAPASGGVQGQPLNLKLDAYGPGVHSDQYGRPIQETPK